MDRLLASVNSPETAREYLQGILDQQLEAFASDAVPKIVFAPDGAMLTSGMSVGESKKLAREKGRVLHVVIHEDGALHGHEFPADAGLQLWSNLPRAVTTFLTPQDMQDFELRSQVISIQNGAARKAQRRLQR